MRSVALAGCVHNSSGAVERGRVNILMAGEVKIIEASKKDVRYILVIENYINKINNDVALVCS